MKTTVLPAVAIPFALALSIGCNGTVRESDGGGGAATTTGVSGSTTSTSSSGGSTGTGGGSGGSLPDAGPGVVDVCQDFGVDGPVFAVRKLSLGDLEPDGTPSSSAWKHHGFNIDGQVSTAKSQDVCKPAGSATPDVVYPDGDAGIDNAFGHFLLPIFTGNDPDFSTKVNADIETGAYNILLWLTGAKAGADQAPFLSRAYGAPPQLSPPNLFGGGCFTVEPRDVSNPMDVKSAKLTFPSSTLSANHWESGVGPRFLLTLKAYGFALVLPIHQVRFAMDLDPAHENAQNGRIGGVLDVEEVIFALKRLLTTLDPEQCGSSTLDSIVQDQVRSAADILKDGAQDPQKTCDGISIGLGFEAIYVTLGQVVLPGPLPKDPCAM